jgi:hypothetical protein
VLRIGFLPSDFNPMVLLLGEAEDFRALGGVLRQFAREPTAVRLDRLAFCAAGGSALMLTGVARTGTAATDPGETGVAGTDAAETDVAGATGKVDSDSGKRAGVERGSQGIVWRLDPDRAVGFAEQLDALADPGRVAGSEMLECSTQEEIPVKASRGEYTEDFLLHD